MTIQPAKIEPEFEMKVRYGGEPDVQIVTIPQEIRKLFNVQKGDMLKLRIIDIKKISQDSTSKEIKTPLESQVGKEDIKVKVPSEAQAGKGVMVLLPQHSSNDPEFDTDIVAIELRNPRNGQHMLVMDFLDKK